MPTSASTGTQQMSTSGAPKADPDYDSMTKEELRAELDARNDEGADLAVSGSKEEMAARLREDDTSPRYSEDAPAESSPAAAADPDLAQVPGGQVLATEPDEKKIGAFQAAIDEKREQTKDETGHESLANTRVLEENRSERNTPDGAPVVTREEDVIGGVRVDLPPSAPADPASLLDPAAAGGVQEVTRPDGTHVVVDTSQPDWQQRADAIRKGERYS